MELTKLGPVLPASYPRVTFRIAGEQQVKIFDAYKQLAGTPIHHGTAIELCQAFVDLRCRPFLRLDGYKPEDRSFSGHQIISSDVDFFYSDHPLVNTKPQPTEYTLHKLLEL